MFVKTLLITPPFTQLNTPYPATSYLKGFLKERGVDVAHFDLSIDLFNQVFTASFLSYLFSEIEENELNDYKIIWDQQNDYVEKVDLVMDFLRCQTEEVAHQILESDFLPKAHRFKKLTTEVEMAFDAVGIIDKAKHYSTLFIEELGDFIQANVDEFFSFTRYAEQIATSASSFNQIEEFLFYEPTIVEDLMLQIIDQKIEEEQPELIGFTIPFPGNLFSSLRCGQFIKEKYPKIKIAFGGGYCNTELRSLSDNRVFNYCDFITLDDGEGPMLKIIEYLSNKITKSELERTFVLDNNKVSFIDNRPNAIHHHSTLPAPDYTGLDFGEYLSFLDTVNPMHRMWTDGRWNKLTISHGCYWKQCSFCDVNLDYIGNYQNTTAKDLVDKIEAVMLQTGIEGFHFVDEAAPPKMMKAMAEELLLRKIRIRWWTNIRFEKTFDFDLCELLAKSGCIAVTGGLETASDRLLKKMKKGVDIEQVANVTNAFTKNGIMVHAYLMYGFPTQTEQETIDSLEIVRQLFKTRCIQSAFWHQFTTTIHSPIGKNPEQFDIKITGPEFQGFAQNDLWHEDLKGADHEKFKDGLNLALQNYLNGVGFEVGLDMWFDFEVPETTHLKGLIEDYL